MRRLNIVWIFKTKYTFWIVIQFFVEKHLELFYFYTFHYSLLLMHFKLIPSRDLSHICYAVFLFSIIPNQRLKIVLNNNIARLVSCHLSITNFKCQMACWKWYRRNLFDFEPMYWIKNSFESLRLIYMLISKIRKIFFSILTIFLFFFLKIFFPGTKENRKNMSATLQGHWIIKI